MGLFSKVLGVDRRDQLASKAVAQAEAFVKQGLDQFTVTVHSTYGGSAQLGQLAPHVVSQLQARGLQVVGVEMQESSYDAFITCRAPEPTGRPIGADAMAWTVTVTLPDGEEVEYEDDRRLINKGEDDHNSFALRYHSQVDPTSGTLTIYETGMNYSKHSRSWSQSSEPRACSGFRQDQWTDRKDR